MSRYGIGYLNQNHTVDVAVNAAGDELYVTDGGRIVVYQISTGQYLREFAGPGTLIMGLAFDPVQDVLYLTEQSQSLLEAVNPANGAVLGSLSGNGTAEGQFLAAQGLRLNHAGLLLVGDSANNRLQVFQPEVPKPTVQLISPLLSIQNGAPVPLMGTVQFLATPLVPQAALSSYTVALGKSAVGLVNFVTGTANVSDGALANLDLRASTNGVYQVQVNAVDQSNLSYQDQTFVSKGKYRFQAAYQSPDEAGDYAVSVENPVNQHLFTGIDNGAPSGQLKILELRGDGRWVEESTLNLSQPGEIAGLACDGTSLYVLTDPGDGDQSDPGLLLRYALPSADGAPLVGPLDQTTVPDAPAGMVLGQGLVYVAVQGEVLAYNTAQLSAPPQALGQGYIQDGGANGIALNAGAAELYVADTGRVVVLGLDGTYRRQFTVNLPADVRGMAYDPTLGILHI
ncbi:MAG TPA: hypothetical protein VK786_07795, partial [bacterium]|nr:hypothetical protein [bacterium]